MEWLTSIFTEHSAVQAVIVLCVLCASGLALGKIKVVGLSLGVTFVFFMGILAGHLGLSIDPQKLSYAQDFGLALLVYALWFQVGPGFFNSLHDTGLSLNLLALGVVLLGIVMTVLLPVTVGISLPEAVGIMCGATTNTPALGAAQQTLSSLGLSASGAALGCALAYPMGVVGVILSLLFMRKLMALDKRLIIVPDEEETDTTYIATYQVHNPGIYGKNIARVAAISHAKFVISRLWRDGKVTIPSAETVLNANDRILVITREEDAQVMTVLFGEQENTDWNSEQIDWNAIDSNLSSRRILITRPAISGKRLGALKLRKLYGVNISRINRNGVQLLATPDLRLLLGDRITVVGEDQSIKNVEKALGNAVADLDEPNLISVFVGMTLGLLLGSIPIALPGISMPVKLGLAGGPIIAGILMGTFGPRIHMNSYVTQSANLMLRAIGLSLYLACLGLASGPDFFATVVRPEGLTWLAAGVCITIVPVLLVGIIALRVMKIDYGTVCGMLSGAMANPMAMDYSSDSLHSNRPSVAYATVYPLSMFMRVILAQVILLLFI